MTAPPQDHTLERIYVYVVENTTPSSGSTGITLDGGSPTVNPDEYVLDGGTP